MKSAALASAAPLLVSTKAIGLSVNMVPSDTEEDNTEDEASAASTAQPAQEAPAVAKTPSPINKDMSTESEALTGLAAGKRFDMRLVQSCGVILWEDFTCAPTTLCTGNMQNTEIIQMTDCQMNQIWPKPVS